MTRRLAAIMFTDVVGSTQLAQRDEKATLELLRDQEELAQPILASHHGRLVKSTGDGMLIEFGSALEAIQCAVEFQRQLHERGARNDDPALRVRIGIHIGDVEDRGGDIFGDAVNVAARVEPLSEAGGICLSGVVWEHVRSKTPYTFERLGPRSLRGVLEPVECYRVVLPWTTVQVPAHANGSQRLAVLPLANLSSDPENEYFADGMTEELITVLSQLQELQVIARTSVTPYKTVTKPVSQIGAELGVGTILEGSVRKAANQVRITVQLIDVASQGHLWSATYDRKLDDIFAVQTEVAEKIAGALKVKIGTAEEKRLEDRPTVHPDSYLAYLKGRSLLYSSWSRDALLAAKKQFELSASIDPENARAFSGLADANTYLGWLGFLGSREEWAPQGRSYSARALELDPTLAEAHCSLATTLWDDWDYTGAEREYNRAISLNPSYAAAHRLYCDLLQDEGRPEEALRESSLAVELDPLSATVLNSHVVILCRQGREDAARPVIERMGQLFPDSDVYRVSLAWWYYTKSDYPSCIRELQRAIELRGPEGVPVYQVPIAWCQALMGDQDGARRILDTERRRAGRSPSPEFLAVGYAFLGDFDEAFRILLEAADEHSLSFQMVRCDRRLEPLRRDARFTQVLKKMNLA